MSTMKTTKHLAIVLATILFSCSKDNDPTPTVEDITGSWAATAIDYTGTTTVAGSPFKTDFTGKGKDMDLTVTLNKNPATFSSSGDYTIALTSVVLGQSTTQDYPFQGFLANGTWTLDGNTLTVTSAQGVQHATIVEQTATTLKINWDYVLAQGPASMDIHGTYAFKKK
ncbi:DUF5004 domain-containing protein [Chryseolinea lacunae]|uniref:DUF5004 domain-containing protein n=1 Tax=Chryseolinea lacunae TaxID=2801331 RepID=A0ABS1KY38_9BACT|nr:lipocalin family protein [Chryseolinea lacunae]MBL0744218.1 DUF5004 domain-containing protein [Chryseolinea lacunae]